MLPQLVTRKWAPRLRTVASRDDAPPAPAAGECAPDRRRLTRSLCSSRPSGNSFLVVYLGSCLASDSRPPCANHDTLRCIMQQATTLLRRAFGGVRLPASHSWNLATKPVIVCRHLVSGIRRLCLFLKFGEAAQPRLLGEPFYFFGSSPGFRPSRRISRPQRRGSPCSAVNWRRRVPSVTGMAVRVSVWAR